MNSVKVKIEGLNFENFLFDLSAANIKMKNIKRKDKTMTFVVSKNNYKLCKEKAEKYNIKITVQKEFGIVNFIKKLPYCIGAFLGILFSIFFVWQSVSYVSNVEIALENNHNCSNENSCIYLQNNMQEIKKYIESLGLTKGIKITNNFEEIEQKVMANFALVKNCSIERIGTKVYVNLVEAKIEDKQNYSAIVAQKNCIITSITTFSGIAKVKAGDIVVAGQVLVEKDGNVLPRADIEARVWNVGTAWHNSKTNKLVKTGNVYKTNAIKFANAVIVPAKSSPFELFEKTMSEKYLTTNFLPIKVETTIYEEVKMTEIEESFEDVRAEIFQKAKNEALKQTVGTPIECTYSVVTEGNITKVDCFLTSVEKIGLKKWEQQVLIFYAKLSWKFFIFIIKYKWR